MSRALTTPSVRLNAAANLAAALLYTEEKDKNKKHIAIDVGCDHAKLSIYLIQSGICSHVYACDINEGPVGRAKENIERRTLKGEPLSNYIDVVLTDGFYELEHLNADRVFILGMGGELIADILDKAEFIRKEQNMQKIMFILQPMTSEWDLRKYLCDNGYDILDEQLVLDKNRIYSVMSVVYDGKEHSYTASELHLGKKNIEKGGALLLKQLERRIRTVEKSICDRQKASLDCSEQEELLSQLNTVKENFNDNN